MPEESKHETEEGLEMKGEAVVEQTKDPESDDEKKPKRKRRSTARNRIPQKKKTERKPKTKSVVKEKKEKKVKKAKGSVPNLYAVFVRNHYKDADVQALPPKQRFTLIAKKWSAHKTRAPPEAKQAKSN